MIDFSNRKFVVLSRPNCVWCDRAKELLRDHNATFAEFDVNEVIPLKDFIAANGLTTVPQVYMDGTHLGGYQNLKAMFDLNLGWS